MSGTIPEAAVEWNSRRLEPAKVHLNFWSETEQTEFLGRRYCWGVMPVRKKPDPELLPIHRPRCPDCQSRMITSAIASGPEGFERRTFECRKCGHAETDIVACDPFESNAAGWMDGETSQRQQ